MSDIFREVDEEVRQDRALALWQKYQNLVIALALIVVVAAGGWKFWQAQQLKAAEEADAQFQTAIEQSRAGKSQDAELAFTAIAKTGPKGYAALASLRGAAELAARDKAGAVKAYDAFAADAGQDPLFRDVARLRAAMLRIDEADRKEMDDRLSPLAAGGAAFRSSARELLALVAMKADDYEAAGRWLDQIVTDTEAPPELKQRAEALLGLVRSERKVAK